MTNPVEQHYTRGGLLDSVLDALRATGHDPDALDPDALAPAEEFHTFGRTATIALAEAAGISATDRVVDVGSGLGGPARFLARRYGCRVSGIDLTEELCEVATDLTRRVGLSDLVEIRQGNALDMPFDDGSFDVAWTQHVSMNIEDKTGLFAEMRRVTETGGRLAFFDILAGPEQPIHFPVPWAETSATSFLASADATREVLSASGWSVRVWTDLTEEARQFYDQLAAGPPAAVTPLGLHLLIKDMPVKGANLRRNVDEGRMVIVRCVADAV